MTDKSKPWLSAGHPEAKACKAVAKKLYTELGAKIRLTGVGVTVSEDGQRAAISIMLFRKADLKKVPKTYDGYEVKAIVTGEIRPA